MYIFIFLHRCLNKNISVGILPNVNGFCITLHPDKLYYLKHMAYDIYYEYERCIFIATASVKSFFSAKRQEVFKLALILTPFSEEC